MPVLLAFVAAALFALATVLQQRVASTASDREALQAGFLLRLARRPQWLLGIAVDLGGFVAQAVALGIGRLVVVQPLLITSVVFALPLGAWLDNQRVGRREVLGAVAVTAGVAGFLAVARPHGGRDDATIGAWILAAAIIGGLSAALTLAGARARPALKAALLGTAAGVMFGLSAALTKATVDRLDDGVLALILDWRVYALIAVGYASMTLSQISLQTGKLAPAVATQMALDPISSLALGRFAFGERLQETALGIAAMALAFTIMVAGLVILAVGRGRYERAGPAGSAPAGAGGADPEASAASSANR